MNEPDRQNKTMFSSILNTRTFLTVLCFAVASVFIAGCRHTEHSYKSTVNYSSEELAEMEKAVIDEGHQPWRLDPFTTACFTLAEVLVNKYEFTHEEASAIADDKANWILHDTKSSHWDADWSHGDMNAQTELANSKSGYQSGIWYCRQIVVQKKTTP